MVCVSISKFIYFLLYSQKRNYFLLYMQIFLKIRKSKTKKKYRFSKTTFFFAIFLCLSFCVSSKHPCCEILSHDLIFHVSEKSCCRATQSFSSSLSEHNLLICSLTFCGCCRYFNLFSDVFPLRHEVFPKICHNHRSKTSLGSCYLLDGLPQPLSLSLTLYPSTLFKYLANCFT